MSRLTQLSTIWTALILIAAVAEAQEKTAQKPIPREATRYDGKTFEEWRDYPRTELKAERRIEAIRAMAAFGTNGYATEAAEAIVAVIRSYPEKGFWLQQSTITNKLENGVIPEKKKLSRDELVFAEAYAALAKIGGPAAPVLLTKLDHPNSFILSYALLTNDEGIVMPSDDISALVTMALSDNEKERDLAIDVLKFQAPLEKLAEPIAKELARRDKNMKVVTVTLQKLRNLSREHSFSEDGAVIAFLNALAPRSPELPALLIGELRESRKARKLQLKNVNDHVRNHPPRRDTWAIVNVLGNIGAAARPSLPELRECARDPDANLRNAAEYAISKITAMQP